MAERSEGEYGQRQRVPWARFDSTVKGGTSLVLTRACGLLIATDLGEVGSVIARVEEATAQGLWAAGFLSYEAAEGLDPALRSSAVTAGESFADLPLAYFALFEEASEAQALRPRRKRGEYSLTPWLCDYDLSTYEEKFNEIKEQIAAGNTYQCNFTTRLRASFSGDTLALYEELAFAQRSEYCAYIDTGRFAIVSASPELFFEWRDNQLTTRPMKGTRRRGRWSSEDAFMASSLLASEKDRAENVMIVDLLRSDLGRIAEYGSVQVPSLLDIERYETVWQLTSTVTAKTHEDVTLLDVFRALFPSGSVTGAPKSSTMALIASLEDSPRGVYCGAIGFVGPKGSGYGAHFNVAIRTVVVDRDTNEAIYGTGGALTWDSKAKDEYEELLVKAEVLSFQGEDFHLIETMGFYPELGFRNLEGHLARLSDSAGYFDFSFDGLAIEAAIREAVGSVTQQSRVRLLLSRSGVPMVEVEPMPNSTLSVALLAVDLEPVQSSWVWLYHKTTRRELYQERAARHLEADDVVMVNERGELTEATRANLVLRLEGQWWTPPIEVGCLGGVERARLLGEGRVQERVLGLGDLDHAEDIALISSLRGWRSAKMV